MYQQIVGGIEYISKLGVVHRDLKPENLLLDHNKTIKIVDFGLSNTYKKGELLKTACGSPCYAAPEMIEGKDYHGTTADVWSSGVILFAMIWGYLPFEDQDTSKLYKKILAADYRTPSFLTENAVDFLKWILNVDPSKRYTIENIRAHKWYEQHEDIHYSGIIVGSDQIPANELLLNKCIELGYEGDYALKWIEANKHNGVTATYNLLLKKSIRDGDIDVKDAYECKNDIINLLRRNPRFRRINDKVHNFFNYDKNRKSSSMQPHSHITKTPQIHSIENINNEYITVQRDYSPENRTIDPESKRRTWSTGAPSLFRFEKKQGLMTPSDNK